MEVFKAIDRLVYFILLCIGIYFCYQGGVWERYVAKKTDFTEHTEELTELPTVMGVVVSGTGSTLKLGEDFNISYGPLIPGELGIKLSYGHNDIEIRSGH